MAGDALYRARQAYARREWGKALALLQEADRQAPLEPGDLERLAVAAHLTGNESDAVTGWTRSYQALLESGDPERAARCAFWLTFTLLMGGQEALSSGWLARAQRLLTQIDEGCVEHGYVLIPVGLLAMGGRDYAGAERTFNEALGYAERSADPDLLTFSLLSLGQAWIRQERVEEGVRLLDEAMVAVAGGEVSPIASGTVYCAVILTCQEVFDLHRAQEWTSSLKSWCDAQPDLVPFRGPCLVHRSEIMQLRGQWDEALTEVRLARARLSIGSQPVIGLAYYQEAELHRLRGDFEVAERLYRQASEQGHEPQPGLSRLRMAQGDLAAATRAIRRVAGEVESVQLRARMLIPYVEIMLAAGEVQAAKEAARELAGVATKLDAPLLLAASAQAEGAVRLAEGDASAALADLRVAWRRWQELECPYEAARVRVMVGLACRQLGDRDTAEVHWDAARTVFERLGAQPDLAQLRQHSESGPTRTGGVLTGRELEVLALVAAGRTNRQIASELVISEHTVARHLSNIFTKLDVSSRTGASAFALEHNLI